MRLYHKIFFSGLLVMVSFCCAGSNSTYITLSNQVSRASELKVLSNNVANAKTTGYEQDRLLFRDLNHPESRLKTNSYVYTNSVYRPEEQGDLKATGRNLDIAVVGRGYFKVLTPRGERYTLNGQLFVSNQNELVTKDGYPIASIDDQAILIPPEAEIIEIVEDGTVYVDVEETGRIGVFTFPKNFALAKEGNSLYSANIVPTIEDDYSVVSGALRASNVNMASSMSELVELQRSYEMTNSLMTELNDLDKQAVEKIMKPNQ